LQTDYEQQYSHKALLGDRGSLYTFQTTVAFVLNSVFQLSSFDKRSHHGLDRTGTFSLHGYILFHAQKQTALQNKFSLNILMLDASVSKWPR